MKPLAAAAVSSVLVTGVAAWSLRATDPALAVAAVATALVLTAWVAGFHGAEGADSGLGIIGPAHLASLTLVGRSSVASALPLIAAQVVGAVVAGGLVLLVGTDGGSLLWDEPSLLFCGVVGTLIGLMVAWSALAADAGSPGWTAAGPIGAGALLGVGLASAAHPAALIGVAVAGVVTWPVALVTAAAVSLGAVVGTFVVSWVTPH